MRGSITVAEVCKLAIGCLVGGFVVARIAVGIYPEWSIGLTRLWLLTSVGSFVCASVFEAVSLLIERKR